MERRNSRKRLLHDDSVSHKQKKQKMQNEPSIGPLSNESAANNWNQLNGYILWLNQYNDGRELTLETISKKLLMPLCKMMNKMQFDEMINVWCDSKLLFELKKRKFWSSDIKIHKACAKLPPKIGDIVYKSQSLQFYSSMMNRNVSASEIEVDTFSSDSDYPGLTENHIKVMHLEQCRVNQRIGYTPQEMKNYCSILGLEYTQENEGDWIRGWIINPRWKHSCSEDSK